MEIKHNSQLHTVWFSATRRRRRCFSHKNIFTLTHSWVLENIEAIQLHTHTRAAIRSYTLVSNTFRVIRAFVSVCTKRTEIVEFWIDVCTEDRRMHDVNWNQSNKATETHTWKLVFRAKILFDSTTTSTSTWTIIIITKHRNRTHNMQFEWVNTTKSNDANRIAFERSANSPNRDWFEANHYIESSQRCCAMEFSPL